MSAGGCLDAGRFDSDAIVQMKTGLLDILQFHITVTVTYYSYRLGMLTLGGLEKEAC